MPTDKQLDANRRNAQKSTGPRTPEGKAKVRLNSLKHGLCAQDAILPGEDVQAFNDLTQSFHEQYKPTGATELFCLHKMLLCYWRTRRIVRYEAHLDRAFYKAEAHLKQLQLERRLAEKQDPVDSPDASDFTPHTEPATPLGKPPVLLLSESIHIVQPVSKVPVPPEVGLLRITDKDA